MAEENTHTTLASYFDKSSSAVREYAYRFEQSYGRPAVSYGIASFEAYPTTSTFIAIFALLSFFPVVFFLSISICTIISIVFIAVSGAIITVLAAEFIFMSILICILTSLLILSIPLTAITILSYIFARLVVLTHSNGRAGIAEWASEAKSHFAIPGSQNERPLRTRDPRGRNANDTSESSGILVEK